MCDVEQIRRTGRIMWHTLKGREGNMLLMLILMSFPVFGVLLFFTLPLHTALPAYLGGCGVSVFYMWKMMGAAEHPVTTGPEGMIGKTGEVLSWKAHEGKVRCYDEVWDARTEDGQALSRGEKVKVVEMRELEMVVRPLEEKEKT